MTQQHGAGPHLQLLEVIIAGNGALRKWTEDSAHCAHSGLDVRNAYSDYRAFTSRIQGPLRAHTRFSRSGITTSLCSTDQVIELDWIYLRNFLSLIHRHQG